MLDIIQYMCITHIVVSSVLMLRMYTPNKRACPSLLFVLIVCFVLLIFHCFCSAYASTMFLVYLLVLFDFDASHASNLSLSSSLIDQSFLVFIFIGINAFRIHKSNYSISISSSPNHYLDLHTLQATCTAH